MEVSYFHARTFHIFMHENGIFMHENESFAPGTIFPHQKVSWVVGMYTNSCMECRFSSIFLFSCMKISFRCIYAWTYHFHAWNFTFMHNHHMHRTTSLVPQKEDTVYRIVLYCISLHCIVLHCFAVYWIVLYCSVLDCFVFYCFVYVLYCIVLCCVVLSRILHCIVLHLHLPGVLSGKHIYKTEHKQQTERVNLSLEHIPTPQNPHRVVVYPSSVKFNSIFLDSFQDRGC